MSFSQSRFLSLSLSLSLAQTREERNYRVLGQWFILPLCTDFQFSLEPAVPDEKTGSLQP